MTMKQLYQLHTSDLTSHQRAIDARVRRLSPLRQEILHRVASGEPLRSIAHDKGVSHGSIHSVVKQSLEAVRKELAREPRYNKTGRKRKHEREHLPAA